MISTLKRNVMLLPRSFTHRYLTAECFQNTLVDVGQSCDGFSPACILSCLFTLWDWAKLWSQYLHEYGFSPV